MYSKIAGWLTGQRIGSFQMRGNPGEVMAFRTDGFGHRSQVPDFVSEMDLFWYVPTNETTCSTTFRKREKVTYSVEQPL
jgi:hypothetical protein